MKVFLLFSAICIISVYCQKLSDKAKSRANHANGGTNCAVCTVIVALVEQLAVIHNETVIKSLDRLCNYLPSPYRGPCKDFADYIGPLLIQALTKEDSPDTACHKLEFCNTDPGKQECHLYPKSKNFHYIVQRKQHKREFIANMEHLHYPLLHDPEICKLPGIKQICEWIDNIFDNHDPAVDLDHDRYSVLQTLRGTSWRGKDCDDSKITHHPGARHAARNGNIVPKFGILAVNSDVNTDSNCNGIMGKDPLSGQPYEDLFCTKSQMRGVAVLGDSVSAHFHLPREWFNTSEFSEAVFEPLPFILENEFDWPELSTMTGYMNNTYSNVIHGAMESVYNKLWQRNHCNHRDYQNIAVNGARSSKMADTIEKSLYRNKTTDYPLIVFYALVGNDVCNGHTDTFAYMTTPEEMRTNVLKSLQYLNATLPKGSHVFLVGLADGRVLYNSLHNRVHPIGSLRNDVTYSDFYDYFNCLEISPCLGWMNSNKTVRNLTTERAIQLTSVLKDIGSKQARTYQNFNLYYVDNPVYQVITNWEKSGNHAWELLEPVDGFHPNQVAQALTAEATWKNLETLYPDVIGPVNINNEKIKDIFGDQGGY